MGRADHDQGGAFFLGDLVQPAGRRGRGVDAPLPDVEALETGFGMPEDVLGGVPQGSLDHGVARQRRHDEDVERRDLGDDEPGARVLGQTAAEGDGVVTGLGAVEDHEDAWRTGLFGVGGEHDAIVPLAVRDYICSGC